jgi:hypothetical protein
MSVYRRLSVLAPTQMDIPIKVADDGSVKLIDSAFLVSISQSLASAFHDFYSSLRLYRLDPAAYTMRVSVKFVDEGEAGLTRPVIVGYTIRSSVIE